MLREETSLTNTDFQFVGIGDHCLLNMYMKEFKMRDRSYPFDWMVSNLKCTKYLLENGLEKMITEHKELQRFCQEPIFQHFNMTTKHSQDYYKRCIDRFNNLSNHKCVLFVMTISYVPKINHNLYTYDDFLEILHLVQAVAPRSRLLIIYVFPHQRIWKIPRSVNSNIVICSLAHTDLKYAVINKKSQAKLKELLLRQKLISIRKK